MRKLTIIVAVVIVLLLGLTTAVAHYAATGSHEDPVQRVTVPVAER
jgi:hypothetical protein